ncbi:hypothetical protein PMIN03_006071 [Paraphaeosphaeria minitans]
MKLASLAWSVIAFVKKSCGAQQHETASNVVGDKNTQLSFEGLVPIPQSSSRMCIAEGKGNAIGATRRSGPRFMHQCGVRGSDASLSPRPARSKRKVIPAHPINIPTLGRHTQYEAILRPDRPDGNRSQGPRRLIRSAQRPSPSKRKLREPLISS